MTHFISDEIREGMIKVPAPPKRRRKLTIAEVMQIVKIHRRMLQEQRESYEALVDLILNQIDSLKEE